MSFLTGGGGKSSYERLLDSATSQMLLEPNWVTNLEICDSIRQQDVTPKYALSSIQKRMRDPNPHVSKYALVVLETCVKNCGQPFHDEIAKNDFLDDMRTLAQTGSAPVKEQVLKMLQAWNHAFRNKTQYQPILATYNLMRMEGYTFPPLNESDAMFSADAAPAWKDGDVCHLCRVKFGLVTRQHHCRACGETFCNKCSSKNTIIPKMGIEREVRVCDTCYDDINPNAGKPEVTGKLTAEGENELPPEYLNSDLAKESQTKPQLSESESKQQEEEELQLALAISLSEEESKLQPKNWSPPAPAASAYEPAKAVESKPPEPKSTLFAGVAESLKAVADDNQAELNKYFDRSYWEKKNAEIKIREPSAPAVLEPKAVQEAIVYNTHVDESEQEEESNSNVFTATMLKSIEMFTNRMNEVHAKGKHIAMDSTVQSLFQSLSAMHPQLIKLIEDEDESKVKYEAMLQKLSVIREARESLNDMRAQHQEKVKQQELEQEMLRRMQMEQKLELMRQQKQEYLEYQRALQMQRQQDLDNYQIEKLRVKQSFGNFPEYAIPGAMPVSMQLPTGFQSIPPVGYLGSPYGSEIPFPNAQIPRFPQQSVQPSESHLSYPPSDRPPQYPGSIAGSIPGTAQHFVSTNTLDHPPDMPPSYATAIASESSISSASDLYSSASESGGSNHHQYQQQVAGVHHQLPHPGHLQQPQMLNSQSQEMESTKPEQHFNQQQLPPQSQYQQVPQIPQAPQQQQQQQQQQQINAQPPPQAQVPQIQPQQPPHSQPPHSQPPHSQPPHHHQQQQPQPPQQLGVIQLTANTQPPQQVTPNLQHVPNSIQQQPPPSSIPQYQQAVPHHGHQLSPQPVQHQQPPLAQQPQPPHQPPQSVPQQHMQGSNQQMFPPEQQQIPQQQAPQHQQIPHQQVPQNQVQQHQQPPQQPPSYQPGGPIHYQPTEQVMPQQNIPQSTDMQYSMNQQQGMQQPLHQHQPQQQQHQPQQQQQHQPQQQQQQPPPQQQQQQQPPPQHLTSGMKDMQLISFD